MTEDNIIEENKYRYDLVSAAAGAAAGAAVGATVGVVGAAAGAAVGAAGAAVATGVVAAAGAAVATKNRHLLIGGLTGLAVYTSTLIGGAVGYNRASEHSLTPYNTGTESGIVITRNDGTQIPYVNNGSGNLTRLEEVERNNLVNLTKDYDEKRVQILDSLRETQE